MVSLDAGAEQEVSRRDTVKGHEFKKDHYVLFANEDFDSVKVESSSMMVVEKFVEASSLDPIYYDASYYLAPDGRARKTFTPFCVTLWRDQEKSRPPFSRKPCSRSCMSLMAYRVLEVGHSQLRAGGVRRGHSKPADMPIRRSRAFKAFQS